MISPCSVIVCQIRLFWPLNNLNNIVRSSFRKLIEQVEHDRKPRIGKTNHLPIACTDRREGGTNDAAVNCLRSGIRCAGDESLPSRPVSTIPQQ